MGFYYLMPVVASVILGTTLISLLTKAMNHPKGTVTNAFLLISGSVGSVFVFTALFPESIFTPIAIYGTQLIIIMKLYNADLFNGLLFLFLGFVFGTVMGEIFKEPLAAILNDFFA